MGKRLKKERMDTKISVVFYRILRKMSFFSEEKKLVILHQKF